MSSLDSLMQISCGLSVLFVEDEESLCQEMTEVLHDIFSLVSIGRDGKEGLEQYLSFHKIHGTYPDIIITDLNMPRLSGVEMSKQMLSLHPEQVIVVLSASDDVKNILEMLNMGVDAYALKPIQYEMFLQTLQRVSKKVMYGKMAKEYTKKLEALAYIDPLTGISNRRRFFKRANGLLLGNNPHLPPFTLCMFDVDRFKEINDRYGHDMGDAVLCYFVDTMKQFLDDKECFSRFGGDEFVVIFQRNEREMEQVLQQIHKKISKTHKLLDKQIDFSVSMGWTQINIKDPNIDVAIKRADIHL